MQGRLARWMPLGSALLTSKPSSSFDVSLKETWDCSSELQACEHFRNDEVEIMGNFMGSC